MTKTQRENNKWQRATQAPLDLHLSAGMMPSIGNTKPRSSESTGEEIVSELCQGQKRKKEAVWFRAAAVNHCMACNAG